MSLLICKIHGEKGAMENASKSVCHQMKNNLPIDQKSLAVINVVYMDDAEFLYDENYFFTKNEFEKLNLHNNYKIISGEDENSFHSLIKESLGIECVQCFKEYMNKNNIEFRFYENCPLD